MSSKTKKITRSAYTRSDGVHVKDTKIPAKHVPKTKIVDRGLPGKGPKLIEIKDDMHLSVFGYALRNSAEERHKSLDMAVKKHGYAKTINRVNAISTIMRNTESLLSKNAKSDVHYLQNHYKN